MNSNKINYIKKFGNKQTLVSELFKEDEINGVPIHESQTELLKNQIVKSRMLSDYTRTYEKSKEAVDWLNR